MVIARVIDFENDHCLYCENVVNYQGSPGRRLLNPLMDKSPDHDQTHQVIVVTNERSPRHYHYVHQVQNRERWSPR